MSGEELERELERLMEGLTNFEKAILLVEAMREVYGTEWTIKAYADGGFSITEDAANVR
jgi:hypothetical protein